MFESLDLLGFLRAVAGHLDDCTGTTDAINVLAERTGQLDREMPAERVVAVLRAMAPAVTSQNMREIWEMFLPKQPDPEETAQALLGLVVAATKHKRELFRSCADCQRRLRVVYGQYVAGFLAPNNDLGWVDELCSKITEPAVDPASVYVAAKQVQPSQRATSIQLKWGELMYSPVNVMLVGQALAQMPLEDREVFLPQLIVEAALREGMPDARELCLLILELCDTQRSEN